MAKTIRQARLSKQKGTSIIEYSLLIAVVVAALIGIQVYVKRAISGNWKSAGDVFGFGRQYEYRGPTNTSVSGSPINTTITTTTE